MFTFTLVYHKIYTIEIFKLPLSIDKANAYDVAYDVDDVKNFNDDSLLFL